MASHLRAGATAETRTVGDAEGAVDVEAGLLPAVGGGGCATSGRGGGILRFVLGIQPLVAWLSAVASSLIGRLLE
jgi:hypothetical protein